MLRFLDSFDHYDTAHLDAGNKWNSYAQTGGGGTREIVTGGRNGNCVKFTAGFQEGCEPIAKRFTNTVTSACIVGFGFKASGRGAFTTNFEGGSLYPDMGAKSLAPQGRNTLLLIRSQDNGNLLYGMVGYTLESNGQIYAWRGEWDATLPEAGFVFLGRTSKVLKPDQWYFLEFKTVVGNAPNGSLEIRVNGETWLTLSSIDTYLQPDGIPHVGWCEVILGHLVGGNGITAGPWTGDQEWYFDDVYIADGDSSATNTVNDFWGDHAIEAKMVTADGAVLGFTPSTAGTHVKEVSDNPPDDDLTYIQANVDLDTDTFVVEDASGAGATVDAVQVLALGKATGESATMSAVLRSGSTVYQGSTFLVLTAYRYANHVWTRDPADNGVISGSDFNAFQVGVMRG